jgi:ABC-2 type transport system permease protein
MVIHGNKLRWLAWLRIKMLTRSFQRSPKSLIFTIIGLLFMLVFAAALAFILFSIYLDSSAPANTEILYLVFTGILIYWIALPLLSYSTNEGLDVSKLQLFPLTRSEIMFSLLFSSLFDIWTVLLFALLGTTVAAWWTHSLALGLMTLLVIVVFYVMTVSISQLILALLMRTLQSRRFRDLSIILLAVFSSSLYIISRLVTGVNNVLNIGATLQRGGFSPYLQWLPSGVAASSIRDAVLGNWGASFSQLVLLILICGLALYLWQKVLERSMTASESSASRRGKQLRVNVPAVATRVAQATASASASATFAPAASASAATHATVTSTYATAASSQSLEKTRTQTDPLKANLFEQIQALVKKELLCFWRDPQLKIRLFQIAIYVVIFVLLPAFSASQDNGGDGAFYSHYPAFASVAVVFLFMLTLCQNTLGIERQSLTALFLFPIDRRRLLWGKNMAIFLMGFGTLILLMIVCTVISPATRSMILPAAMIGLAGLGITLGWGNFASVYFPRYQRPMGRTYQATGGPAQSGGCLNSLMSLLMLAVTVVTLTPVALGIGIPFFMHVQWLWIAAVPFSLVYGVVLYIVLTNMAATRMLATEPEILKITTRE